MDASGKDDVLLETVGVGQAEIDVVDHADTIVLALMPGSGDSIQALKAGVMEIPDVIVINKADHPLTDTMVREVRRAGARAAGLVEGPGRAHRGGEGRGRRRAAPSDRRAPRATSRPRGTLEERRAPQPAQRGAGAGRGAAAPRARGRAPPGDSGGRELLDRVVRREIDPATAAREVLESGAMADDQQAPSQPSGPTEPQERRRAPVPRRRRELGRSRLDEIGRRDRQVEGAYVDDKTASREWLHVAGRPLRPPRARPGAPRGRRRRPRLGAVRPRLDPPRRRASSPASALDRRAGARALRALRDRRGHGRSAELKDRARRDVRAAAD